MAHTEPPESRRRDGPALEEPRQSDDPMETVSGWVLVTGFALLPTLFVYTLTGSKGVSGLALVIFVGLGFYLLELAHERKGRR